MFTEPSTAKHQSRCCLGSHLFLLLCKLIKMQIKTEKLFQEVSERQRTRSSSWGEREFQLLGEKERKKVEKERKEEERKEMERIGVERRREEEERRRREEEMRMEEMRREEIMMQEDELRREANMAMQSYYSYGSQGVAESYRREESALNSSR